MDSQASHKGGASALPGPVEPLLKEAITGLLHLNEGERERLDSYSLEDCNAALQRLTDYINNPAGKPTRTIQDVVGETFMVHQRKAQLQAIEQSAQIVRLQQENSSLRQDVRAVQVALDQAVEERDLLLADVRRARLGAGLRREEEWTRQVSMGADRVTQEERDDVPGLEAVGPTGLDHQSHSQPDDPRGENPRASLPSETTLSRRLETLQLSNPAQQEVSRNSRITSFGVTPNSVTFDDYPAPPSGRSWVASAPRHGAAPLSTLSHPRFGIQGGDYSHVRGGVDDRGRPLARELYAPRSTDPGVDRTPSPSRKGRSLYHRHDDLTDSGASDTDSQRSYHSRGLRTRQVESLAKDIERFDPSNRDTNVDDYLREVERCLVDLPDATSREKLKLIWKTTARSVHVFMETLPPDTRDRYSTLRQALREEYSPYTDEASATLSAFAILQKKHESPRDFYRRLRTAYFQGHNAPGLEEDRGFKSLFLHNLHESLRYDVTMYCRTRGLSIQEIKRYAQLAWETRMRPTGTRESDSRVLGIQLSETADLALEGNEMPRAKTETKTRPPRRKKQGGQQNQGGGSSNPNPNPSN